MGKPELRVVIVILLLGMLGLTAYVITLHGDIDDLNEAKRYIQQEHNEEIDEFTSLLETCREDNKAKMLKRDFSKLSVSSKLVNLRDFVEGEQIYQNRTIVKLPNGKYQIFIMDNNGNITHSTVDHMQFNNMKEVKEYIEKYPYLILE